MRATSSTAAGSEVAAALRQSRAAFVAVGLLSAAISLLALTGSIYMLQVYDRAIPSRSIPTLVGLTVLMVGLYAAFGAIDVVRTRLMARIGGRLERLLRERAFAASVAAPVRLGAAGERVQPIRDLDAVRAFLSGPGPTALFDLPFMAVFLVIIYLLHPLLFVLAAGGALVLIVLTVLTEWLSRAPAEAAAQSGGRRHLLGEAGRRNAEVVQAMGMAPALAAHWSRHSAAFMADQQRAADVTGGLGGMSRVLRMVLQSAMLGLGALLVVRGEASGGVIIAASITLGRALAPVEVAIANWRGFIAARQGAARLARVLALLPAAGSGLPLPKPSRTLAVEGLASAAPGETRPVVANVSFALAAGAGLGIIGPSASGKSSLVRALVGAWLPLRGHVRLDGATLDQWRPEAIGAAIGYLPQDVELFAGTVAENIARFDQKADPEAVIAAARAAGIYEMVLRLPAGFETQIGEGGAALSAGQRQRVGLARALYGDPFLVVLDEPNSNLDAEGEAALAEAIRAVRRRGGIAIVVAHRPSALAALDQLLMLSDGQVVAFGPRDEVLRKVTQPERPPVAPEAQARAVARRATVVRLRPDEAPDSGVSGAAP